VRFSFFLLCDTIHQIPRGLRRFSGTKDKPRRRDGARLSHLHFFVPLVSLVGKKRIAHEEHQGHEEEGKEQDQEVTGGISSSLDKTTQKVPI